MVFFSSRLARLSPTCTIQVSLITRAQMSTADVPKKVVVCLSYRCLFIYTARAHLFGRDGGARARRQTPKPEQTMAPKLPSQHAAEKAAEAKAAAKEARAEVNERQFNPTQMAAKKKAESQAWIFSVFIFFVSDSSPDPTPPPPPPHVFLPPSPYTHMYRCTCSELILRRCSRASTLSKCCQRRGVRFVVNGG